MLKYYGKTRGEGIRARILCITEEKDMTEKELREIKMRFRPERSNIPRIVGCFVNGNGQIVSKISQALALGDSVVTEMLLKVMKKSLSGSLGTNLTDVSFTTKQVSESEEHKLLMRVRDSGLKDTEALDQFYSKVIECTKFEGNFVILLANDVYDVPKKHSDGEGDDSYTQFSYIVCAICPIKESAEALAFREADSLFHSAAATSLLSSPEIGFMFPAFDDRATNIYGALYYTRSLSDSHPDFTEKIFGTEAPMPPKAQKATFSGVLTEALSDECSYEVIRSVHAQIAEMVEVHKESHDPEPLTVTKATVKSVLEYCGVAEDAVERVGEAFDESFGKNAALTPKNIITTNKYEVTMPEVSVKISPEHRDAVSTETRNGEKYLLIKVTGPVEVNGIGIAFEEP